MSRSSPMKPMPERTGPTTSLGAIASARDSAEGMVRDRNSAHESPRRSLCGALTATIALVAAGVLAVGIAMSAILVVSRETISPTGAVIPTRQVAPSTTSEAPTATANSPTATRASPVAPVTFPPAPDDPTPPSAAPAPRPPPARPRMPANTVLQPTSHRPFPLESTDFPGPYG